LLLSLGLASPTTNSTKSYVTPLKKIQAVSKRKRQLDTPKSTPGHAQEDAPEARRKRVSLASTIASPVDSGSPLRRSERSIKAAQRFGDEVYLDGGQDSVDDDEDADGVKTEKRRRAGEPQRMAKSLGVRTQNPQVLIFLLYKSVC
jgi:hypothetical protein